MIVTTKSRGLLVTKSGCGCCLKVRPVTGGSQSSEREARLLSNPLGLSGHENCQSNGLVGGDVRLGVCYNELECLASGGIISGYCQSPVGGNILVRGVCCVHTVRTSQSSRASLSYLHNIQWPDTGNGSLISQYTILPNPDTCFLRWEQDNQIISHYSHY